ncbi:hypothetical protein PENTCL1PPCAC_15584, partial [Pristionchus entomophagus]
NSSLRFGLEFDRDYLHNFVQQCQTLLPCINSLTLHPLMLILLRDSKSMSSTVRLGYFLTEITLVVYDWIFNFCLRMYPISPYSALYCGGPACRMIGSREIIMLILSFNIVANIPCFLFLVIRMHKQTSRGLSSTLNLTGRKKRIVKDPELRWLTDRGGQLFVFGNFGDAPYFKYELYILGASLLTCGPVPCIITFDAMKNLSSMKKVAASTKTHKMTKKLLSLFIVQLNCAMMSMVFPLSLLLSSMVFDLHEILPAWGLLAMRILITV